MFLLDTIGQQTDPTRRAKEALKALDSPKPAPTGLLGEALDRHRKWEALPEGCSMQIRYAVYPGQSTLAGVNMARQRDLRALAAAYADQFKGEST